MEQINEALAREAKHANSWGDYIEGSATAQYNTECARAREAAEARKKQVPEEYWAELDALVERYCAKLASWTNKENACRASCPSIMIAGGSNFPVRKKEKQNARMDALMREYLNVIKPLLEKIENFGVNGFPIKAGDANAIQKLEAKLAEAEERQRIMKSRNAYYRKHKTLKGCEGVSDELAEKLDKQAAELPEWDKSLYSSYELTNNNANIKRMRERLETLKREKAADGCEYDTAGLDLTVEENREIMRLQVFFEGKPSEGIRNLLKAAAFKWAPSQNAWQRQLTDNARVALRSVLKTLKEKEGSNE